MSWLPDIEALQAWIAEATAAGVVAIDTVADGPDAMRAGLAGFSLATAPGRACYVPLRPEAELGDQVPVEMAVAALAPLLRDASVLKVLFDAKSDLMVLERAGAPRAAPIDDAMLISYAMEAGAHGHGMEELSALHLGHTPASLDSITGTGRARLAFRQVPLDRATAWAGENADVTLRLWQVLRPRLRGTKSLALYELLERRLVDVLRDMERAGVKVDKADLRAM